MMFQRSVEACIDALQSVIGKSIVLRAHDIEPSLTFVGQEDAGKDERLRVEYSTLLSSCFRLLKNEPG